MMRADLTHYHIGKSQLASFMHTYRIDWPVSEVVNDPIAATLKGMGLEPVFLAPTEELRRKRQSWIVEDPLADKLPRAARKEIEKILEAARLEELVTQRRFAGADRSGMGRGFGIRVVGISAGPQSEGAVHAADLETPAGHQGPAAEADRQAQAANRGGELIRERSRARPYLARRTTLCPEGASEAPTTAPARSESAEVTAHNSTLNPSSIAGRGAATVLPTSQNAAPVRTEGASAAPMARPTVRALYPPTKPATRPFTPGRSSSARPIANIQPAQAGTECFGRARIRIRAPPCKLPIAH
jgi:hypothetical protein